MATLDTGLCQLCGRAPGDPVTLGCGHTYCGDCAPRYRGAEGAVCAWCSIGLEQRLSLPSEESEGLGRRGSEMRERRSVRPLCEEHQEEVKLFCETERKMICVNCLDRRDERSHTSHNFMLLNEAVDIYKEKINNIIYSLKQRKTTFQDFELKQQESISDIKEQSDKVQMLIGSEFAKLRSILDEKERSLVRELNEEKDDILGRMETNLREIRDNSQDTQQKLSYIEMQLSQQDVFSLLVGKTSQDQSEEEYHPRIVAGSLSLGAFQGPTQYRVWRQVKDIIHPNCRALKKDHST